MAPLQLPKLVPFDHLSEKSSPPTLRKVLELVFSNIREKLWLVGGTALSGYYAENRRSDDLDLFAGDEATFRDTIRLVKGLGGRGAVLTSERSSPFYYHTGAEFLGHSFTIDVVLDENLHRFGSSFTAKDGVCVADIATLFSTKAACLVSRCSEKDLFDLCWILQRTKDFDMNELIRMGREVDGGLNVETLLISLNGARLRKEACHFLLQDSPLTVDGVYEKIAELRAFFIQALLDLEKKQSPSEEARTLKEALTLRRKLRQKKNPAK